MTKEKRMQAMSVCVCMWVHVAAHVAYAVACLRTCAWNAYTEPQTPEARGFFACNHVRDQVRSVHLLKGLAVAPSIQVLVLLGRPLFQLQHDLRLVNVLLLVQERQEELLPHFAPLFPAARDVRAHTF